jgi:hypothetical protein
MIMKKIYLKPEVEFADVVTSPILSNSKIIDPNAPGGKPRSNENRGEWGNVWGN